MTRISRNPGILLFQFALPTLQIVLFCLAIGRSLMGVNVSVVMKDEGLPGVYVCVRVCICTELYMYIYVHQEQIKMD